MSFERAKYEFPIDVIDQHHRAGAPAGIYLLDGEWHLAVHDSAAERVLIDRGALLVATLTFALQSRPVNVSLISAQKLLPYLQVSVS